MEKGELRGEGGRGDWTFCPMQTHSTHTHTAHTQTEGGMFLYFSIYVPSRERERSSDSRRVARMPPGSDKMRDKALAKAIAKGPRMFTLGNGEERLAFGLSKVEVKQEFFKEKYNTSTGSRWRTAILEWLDPTYNCYDKATISNKQRIGDKKEQEDWSIIFCLMDESSMIYLTKTAEQKNVDYYPHWDLWNHAVSETYGAY